MNQIALQRTVADMIAEYDAKAAILLDEAATFEAACRRAQTAACVGGVYGGDIFWRDSPGIDEKAMKKALLISGWKAIYSRLQIDRIATAKDKALWERTIADPPPLTAENAVATFGDYLLRSRFHILRGLAEAFSGLDPAYRSHLKVKIGRDKLPKRVIIGSVGYSGSYGREKLLNVLNALATYRGQPLVEHCELRALDDMHSSFNPLAGEVVLDGTHGQKEAGKEAPAYPNRGVRIKKFANGNAHIFFDPAALLDINRALAEFYGDVLPDAEGEEPGKAPSTAVAKDLQFYPTPTAVIDKMLYAIGLTDMREVPSARQSDYHTLRVLEPSCGDGRIMDAVRARGHAVLGFEVHAGRAAEARTKGHAVVTGDFLEQPPTGDFSLVVMNPPFYGRHYIHHVRHALKFLKPGGRLITVLPASAWYDHGELKGEWRDLPVASFADSGTNIPTGMLVMRADGRDE